MGQPIETQDEKQRFGVFNHSGLCASKIPPIGKPYRENHLPSNCNGLDLLIIALLNLHETPDKDISRAVRHEVTGSEKGDAPIASVTGRGFRFAKSFSGYDRCAPADLITRYHLKYEDISEILLKYEISDEKQTASCQPQRQRSGPGCGNLKVTIEFTRLIQCRQVSWISIARVVHQFAFVFSRLVLCAISVDSLQLKILDSSHLARR